LNHGHSVASQQQTSASSRNVDVNLSLLSPLERGSTSTGPFTLRTGNLSGGIISTGSSGGSATSTSNGGGSSASPNNGANNAISLLPSTSAAHHLSNLHATAQHIFAQHAAAAAAANASHAAALEGHSLNTATASAVAAPFFVHHSAGLLQILMAAERCQV